MFELFDSYVGKMFGYSLAIIGVSILIIVGIVMVIRYFIIR